MRTIATLMATLAALPGLAEGGGRARSATVTKMAHAEWLAAAASPDGRWLATWADDGLIDLYDVARREVMHRVLPDSYGPGSRLAWSPDSRHLAFWTDGGLGVYDLDTDATRTVTRATITGFAPYVLAFGFDPAGVLFWVDGQELWRDGARAAVATLPASTPGYRLFDDAPTGSRWLLSCDYPPGYISGTSSACQELWVTDLATGASRSIFKASTTLPPAFEPLLSPAQDRVCYLGAQLRCVDLATGADVAIAAAVTSWGHLGYPARPFSPSGRALTFAVERGDRRVTMVHDFASGTSRPIAATGHLDRAFVDEHHLLLFEQWGTIDDQERTRGPRVQVAEIDARTGALTPVVIGRNQMTVPVMVPGHPEVLFMGREIGGGRDLVRVDRRVAPASATTAEPAATIPAEGTATFYWPGGARRAEGPVQKGTKHGTWTLWYPDGTVWLTGEYFWGQEQGTWSYFHPGGRRGFELGYHLATPDGPWRWWDPDGTLREEGTYHLGSPDGTWTSYYANGAKRAVGMHVGGSWSTGSRHFCPDGRELRAGKRCRP